MVVDAKPVFALSAGAYARTRLSYFGDGDGTGTGRLENFWIPCGRPLGFRAESAWIPDGKLMSR